MKLHFLISVVLLGMAVGVRAQNVPGATPAVSGGKPVAGNDLNSGIRIETLTLKAGLLGEVVAQVERHFTVEDPKKPDVAMPNILFGTDTHNAEVPGDLRMRGVSPLQAVALAAAAAGCTLEPIFAPKEAPDVSAQKAIGYRIVRVTAFTRLQSPVEPTEQPLSELDRQINTLAETLGQNHPSVVAVREHLKQLMSAEQAGGLVGIGIALAKKDGVVVVEEVIPGSPASLAPAIKPGRRILSVAEEGKPEVDVTGLELEKVVQLIRGAPGTAVKITLAADTKLGMGEHVFSLVRAKLPVKPVDAMFPKVMVVNPNGAASGLPGLAGGGGVSGDNQGIALSGVSFTQSAQGNVPFVRVYAVGSVQSGSDREIVERESRLRQLVVSALAMDRDARGDKMPDLDFHKQSRALIVRATAGQQEIIAQVIKALKENETQPAATAKP